MFKKNAIVNTLLFMLIPALLTWAIYTLQVTENFNKLLNRCANLLPNPTFFIQHENYSEERKKFLEEHPEIKKRDEEIELEIQKGIEELQQKRH